MRRFLLRPSQQTAEVAAEARRKHRPSSRFCAATEVSLYYPTFLNMQICCQGFGALNWSFSTFSYLRHEDIFLKKIILLISVVSRVLGHWCLAQGEASSEEALLASAIRPRGKLTRQVGDSKKDSWFNFSSIYSFLWYKSRVIT